MNSKWKTVSIGSVCENIFDGPHATPAKTDSGPIFLGISNLQGGRIDLTGVEHLSEEDFIKWTRRVTPKANDIVFSYETRLGEVALVPDNLRFCLGRRMALMRPDLAKVYPRFLLYAYLGPEFQDTLRARTVHGSTVDRIPLIEFPSFPITLPSLPEQRAIADVLGSLDDKIELNRRMNTTLEALARALFKSWFVDFDPVRAKMEGRVPSGMDAETAALFPSAFEGDVPQGWKTVVLDDLAEFILGGDWGKDNKESEFPIPAFCIRGADIPDLQSGGMGKMPLRFLKKSSIEKRSLRQGDLVVEISGGSPTQSTGRPVFISDMLIGRLGASLTCSNFCRFLRPKKVSSSLFIYYLLRWLYSIDEFFQYENGTTGIKNFAFSVFCQDYKIIFPPENILNAFNSVVMPLFETMQSNAIQNNTLAALRDTLLPRLMSGEVRVKDVEKES
jgi:type I restriction enzyme, S subunit